MSAVKVVELIGLSSVSWEDAVRQVVKEWSVPLETK